MAKKTEKEIKQSKINTWKPKNSSEIFVGRDGKLFECYFEKVFITNKDITKYNRFFINKSSYENQLDHIVSYINFFINFYDRDMEVMTAYLKFADEIGKERTYDIDGIDGFIDLIYEILFTPTVIDKIRQLTEDNYKDDIESSSDDKKHYLKSEKKHLESLEFTNQHIKVLLCISMAIKIMCPVMLHFTKINQIPIGKYTDTIFKFYKRLFTIFGYGTNYSIMDEDGFMIVEEVPYEQVMEHVKLGNLAKIQDGYTHRYYFVQDGKKLYYTPIKINIYNKLYIYCKAKVLESNASNSPIFAQREITGIDVFSVIESFTRRVLITENIVKYRFNDNIVGFNKTIVKFQLSYFLKESYAQNLVEISNVKPSDNGLSSVDKVLMTQSKLDEGVIALEDINIALTTKRLDEIYDVDITEDEIDYYMRNFSPTNIQIDLIYAYFAKYFGAYRPLLILNRRNFVKLALILKKQLLLSSGFDNDNEKIRCTALPYVLTGNLYDKVNMRNIRNTNFTSKIDMNYMYQRLTNPKNGKYKHIAAFKDDFIKYILSGYVNTRFTYCSYEHPEINGEEILYSEEKICDEVLMLLDNV